MIQVENKPTVESNGITETASFGIKESGIGHIFHILRNQLYSDKETAVLREYATNAADAHVEAGHDLPISITLPSRFNLELKIRDFGPSLNEREIKDIFAFYGESTKRNTNNQTGMLGIGSKSAFAYGDNFVINAYIKGQRTTYNAFIDDSKIGCIAKLSVEPTNETDGLEIVIPVKGRDVDEFHNKAKNVFEHFRSKVVVNGKDSREFFSYDEENILYEGEGWKWDSKGDKYKGATAVMGNIGYPIDDNLLKELDDSLSDFSCGNLTLEFPIGDLEISASREGLQYSDYTIKKLTNKIKLVAKEMAEKLEASFNECESLWQAKVLSHEVFDYHGSLHSAKRVLKKDIKWRGKSLGDTYVSLRWHSNDNKKIDGKHMDELMDVMEYEKTWRGHQKVRAGAASTISAQKETIVVVNHESHRRGALKRIVPLKENQGKRPYLITFRKEVKESTKEKVLKHLGFCDDDYVVLDTLPEVQLSAVYGASNRGGKTNTKAGQSVFVYNGSSTYSPQSANWDATSVDLDNEKVLYVEIERFEYKRLHGSFLASRYLHGIVADAKKLNIDLKIIGVKPKQLKKFQDNENATLLWDYLKEQVNNKIEELKLEETNARFDRTQTLDSSIRNFCREFKNYKFGNNSLGDLIKEYNSAIEAYGASEKELATIKSFAQAIDLQIQTPKLKVDVVQLHDAAMKLYPMLPPVIDQMSSYYWDGRNSDSIKQKVKKDVSDYVNLVNKSVAV